MKEKENIQIEEKKGSVLIYVLLAVIVGLAIGYKFGYGAGFIDGGDYAIELVAESLNISLGD